MSFAKARFEGIAKVKNNFTRLKPPNTAACNFYNADKGNSEGKVGTHMDVAKNAAYRTKCVSTLEASAQADASF